jgi:hypothetical protein
VRIIQQFTMPPPRELEEWTSEPTSRQSQGRPDERGRRPRGFSPSLSMVTGQRRKDASAAVKTAWRPVPESIPGGATIGSYIVSLHWLNIALYIVVCSFVSLFFTWFIYMCVSVQLWVKRRKS